MSFSVGIDFGTSTSEVVVCLNGEPIPILAPGTRNELVLPSLVAVDDAGAIRVGFEALPFLGTPQCVSEVKRKLGTSESILLGGKSFLPEEIAAMILSRLKEVTEEAMGGKIDEVVLSVPANFPDPARQATLRAASLAKLVVSRLLNEPNAAAVAFGYQDIWREDQILVFDFGGGTLDISVIEMMEGVLDVRSSYGDPELGGKDIDDALVNLLIRRLEHEEGITLPRTDGDRLDRRTELQLKQVAEQAKIRLSTESEIGIDLPSVGVRGGSLASAYLQLTRQEFQQAIQHVLFRARECLRRAMGAKDVRPSAITQVLMVGGTTRIPAVRSLVEESLGRNLRDDVDPILAVATGSAITAATSRGMISEDKRLVMTDVSPYGLGVGVLHRSGSTYILAYEGLIKPNETIPSFVEKSYTLLRADQTRLELTLLQDHEGTAKLAKEAISVAQSTIENIPHAISGIPHEIIVEFSYDLNGTIKCNARLPATGQRIEMIYDSKSPREAPSPSPVGHATPEEVVPLDTLVSKPRFLTSETDIRLLLPVGWEQRSRVAKSLLASGANGDLQLERVRDTFERLNRAIEEGNVDSARSAEATLTDLLFELERPDLST